MTVIDHNLTYLEEEALRGGLNVADGHPRMALTESQREIMSGLGRMHEEVWKRTFEDVEAQAQRAFLGGLGQRCAPIGTGRLLSCYSSSTAMDIVARTLASRTSTVALIHPTFDNIPDLLKSRGLQLHPIAEEEFGQGEPVLPQHVGAVFVTTPNNPTGRVMPAPVLGRLAEDCARHGRVLVLDTSFRAQDRRAQYDTYQVLDEAGVEWVVIEDTGKLWPTFELKAGFLAWGQRTTLPLFDAFSDLLLSISPIVLLLIERLAEDANNGGYQELHRLIRTNRETLAAAVAPSAAELADPDSRISVARLRLPAGGPDGYQIYEDLVRRDVHVLPCGPFHWARRELGAHYIRVALAREPADLARAAQVLVDVVGPGSGGTAGAASPTG